jgi:hypothetical protein
MRDRGSMSIDQKAHQRKEVHHKVMLAKHVAGGFRRFRYRLNL